MEKKHNRFLILAVILFITVQQLVVVGQTYNSCVTKAFEKNLELQRIVNRTQDAINYWAGEWERQARQHTKEKKQYIDRIAGLRIDAVRIDAAEKRTIKDLQLAQAELDADLITESEFSARKETIANREITKRREITNWLRNEKLLPDDWLQRELQNAWGWQHNQETQLKEFERTHQNRISEELADCIASCQ